MRAPAAQASGEQGTGRFYCIAGFCSTLLFATIEFAAVEAGAGAAGAPAPLRWDRDLVWVPHLALAWVIRNLVPAWELGVLLPPTEHPGVVPLPCLSQILSLLHF